MSKNYGYKTIFDDFHGTLVVIKLEILGVNNEHRLGVCNTERAKFRCSLARVVYIHGITSQRRKYKKAINLAAFSFSLLYRQNELVRPDRWDANINKVCSNGIHYFKTKAAAIDFGTLVGFIQDCGCIGGRGLQCVNSRSL